MTISYENPPPRGTQASMATLTDRFEIVKEIGDGSFGSVGLARVRTAGANVARRGTLVSQLPLALASMHTFLLNGIRAGRHQDHEKVLRIHGPRLGAS